jgi:alpha-L-rhamnosidase
MKKILSLLFLGIVCSSTIGAQEKWKDGILVDEFIYTKASFPSAHSATIVETPKGLMAAWFGGAREGAPDVEIYMSRLEGNDKWTPPVSIANGIINDTLRYACYNPVLYQVPGGELILFYKVGPKVAAWVGWMKRSFDNGHTWGKPELLPDGGLGPVKNRPVMVGNELFCPSSTEVGGWKLHFEITKDKGKTWRKIGPINDGKTVQSIQPSILFHGKNKLQVLCRTRQHHIGEAWSYDGGQTWTDVTLLKALPNNNSGTDALTLKDGRHLLVYNHVLPDTTWVKGKGPRTPLNVALSKNGKTWYASLVLEDSPISQYSYPSVMQSSDGMVHIVYTWRRETIKYVKIDPSKLKMKKIKNQQWPGGQNKLKQFVMEE